MLNDLIEFAEPYTQEEMEEVLAEKQNNDFLGGQRSHFSDELFAILDFVPEGFAIDADLEEDPDTAKDKTEIIPIWTLGWKLPKKRRTPSRRGLEMGRRGRKRGNHSL